MFFVVDFLVFLVFSDTPESASIQWLGRGRKTAVLGSIVSIEAWLNTEEEATGKPEFVSEVNTGKAEDITDDTTGNEEVVCDILDVHRLGGIAVPVTAAAGDPENDVEGDDTGVDSEEWYTL